MSEADLLYQVEELQRASAEQHNLILNLLQRTITGPSVIETAAGWVIQASGSGSGSGGFPLCVMRSIDVDSSPNKMMAQEITHNDDPLLPGELYRHTVAIGDEFEVFPAPTWEYEMYKIEGASPKPATPNENLSHIVPWWYDSDFYVFPTIKFSREGMSMLDPNETQSAAGGQS